MGLFTCMVAIAMVVLYQVQDGGLGQFYSAFPGSLLAKTYLNSMMAVLNARKAIRERQQLEVGLSPMELPTIPTIR
jgi:regulator of sirC expression with transglutaminase-like and TPR domain